MKKIALKIENLSKKYKLGSIGVSSLKADLLSLWRKEKPSLQDSSPNILNVVGRSDNVWALKNISFEVPQGEVLGIIGKNGAGKSTLLKILSKVTGPTTGTIKIKGRIASLLEVGTGFHEELTGRENIFLNGAILGMSKMEIRSKFDEIIDFAGISQYLDTPVKRYSSGMRVRLGFAVAAFLEPEILIVDEVLAVGDAEFQKKAIGKMQDVTTKQGRTVLFVSHNMNSVISLCTSCMMLKNGLIHSTGKVENVVNEYLQLNSTNQTSLFWDENSGPGNDEARLTKARLINKNTQAITHSEINQKIGIEFEYIVNTKVSSYLIPSIHLYTLKEECVFVNSKPESEELKEEGKHKAIVWLPENLLNQNIYSVRFSLASMNPYKIYIDAPDIISFETIEDIKLRTNEYKQSIPGVIRPILHWESSLIK
ncbi:MAG TPA: ABC transporter ATP-binding protein [Cytophagaceae bacterium]|jgi:lipopolysaccharide transport system ATP-binding protein|nr:ABC transporter ATP-binding protein [Cytophagaceae bacterium]